MNKIVINHLDKLFVTNDASTVIKELEVEHPAARMIVMATQMMAQEVHRHLYQSVCLTLSFHPSPLSLSPSLPPPPLSQCGDGTNFVLVLAGALLDHAEELLRMGLSPAEVVVGYEMACNKALDILPGESCNGQLVVF